MCLWSQWSEAQTAATLGTGSQEDTVFLGQQNRTAFMNTPSDHPHSFGLENLMLLKVAKILIAVYIFKVNPIKLPKMLFTELE